MPKISVAAGALLISLFLNGFLVTPTEPEYDGPIRVRVDGEPVDVWEMAELVDGEIWVPLKPVAEALGAEELRWDGDLSAATVSGGGISMEVPALSPWFAANGRYFYLPDGARIRDDRLTLPLSSLARAFGAGWSYDGRTRTVELTSGEPIESGDSFYSEEDVYWLSHIINAEAGNEPFAGKIAVGNVVTLRASLEGWPDDIKGVIFDNRFGIQFSPAYSGSIYLDPNEESVIAAKLALEGVTVVHALYFSPVSLSKTSWAGKNCEVVTELGGHVFFI